MGVKMRVQAEHQRAAAVHLRHIVDRFLAGKEPATEVDRAVEGWLLVREVKG